MKRIYLILFISFVLLLFGCFDLFNPSYWKSDGFSVGTDPGNPSALQLTNSNNSILLSSIIKIGDNDRFIIVENEFKYKSYFWIIEKEKNRNFKMDLEGPFDFNGFVKRKKELGFENLKFDREWKRNK